MQRTDSLEKTLMLGKIDGRRKRGQQGEMAGWHLRLDGREFEQALGVGDGQGGLGLQSRMWLSNWTELNSSKLTARIRCTWRQHKFPTCDISVQWTPKWQSLEGSKNRRTLRVGQILSLRSLWNFSLFGALLYVIPDLLLFRVWTIPCRSLESF